MVQIIKCPHQVALDHGDWSTGQWLLPIPDPSGRSEFGGDEDELKWIHNYKKSLKDLRSRMAQADLEERQADRARFLAELDVPANDYAERVKAYLATEPPRVPAPKHEPAKPSPFSSGLTDPEPHGH